MTLGGGEFVGVIDELRVSDVIRYFGAHTPLRRMAVDASTIALFHFDEGTGTNTIDAVGPGRHMATLNSDAEWVSE
jgi:hypothetical protein